MEDFELRHRPLLQGPSWLNKNASCGCGFCFQPVCGCVKFAADSLPNVLPVVHHTMPPTPSDWPYASEPAALAPGTNIDQAKEPERTQKPLNLNGPSTAGIWNAPPFRDGVWYALC